ncbi:MAG: hypothetical protein VW146_01725 [Gammaproteobacteria bacterium]
MKNKTILLILLISPVIVIGLSSLAFTFGYGPVATKNYGTFFEKSFPVHSLENLEDNPKSNFNGRTWILGIYGDGFKDLEQAMYVMKQVNIALNRDIYKLDRYIFFNSFSEFNFVQDQFPRVILQQEIDSSLRIDLETFSKDSFFETDKIFLVDPYGRAVMYYDLKSIDPKKLLKDLKVLI